MFDSIQIFHSNNEKAIDDLQEFLKTSCLKKMGIRTKKRSFVFIDGKNDKSYYYIVGNMRDWRAIVDVAYIYFDNNRTDKNIGEIYVNNNESSEKKVRSIRVTDIPLGKTPDENTLIPQLGPLEQCKERI